MFANKPRSLVLIALLQVVPIALLPPGSYRGLGIPVIAVGIVLFGILGASLLRGRRWARSAAIFAQGMNIIVRLLMSLSNAMVDVQGAARPNVPFLVTAVVSMALSGLVLYAIDQPEIEMAMQ